MVELLPVIGRIIQYQQTGQQEYVHQRDFSSEQLPVSEISSSERVAGSGGS